MKHLVLKLDTSVFFTNTNDIDDQTVSILKFVEKAKETLDGFESLTLYVKSKDFKLYDEPLKDRCIKDLINEDIID